MGTDQQEALVSMASLGVVATPGLLTANDSDVLTNSELESLIHAAQEDLLQEGHERHKAAAKSERKRRELADRILSSSGHELLGRIHAKLAEHGIELPTIQVEFRNVRVTTGALFGSAGIPTVGSIPLSILKVRGTSVCVIVSVTSCRLLQTATPRAHISMPSSSQNRSSWGVPTSSSNKSVCWVALVVRSPGSSSR